MTIFHYYVWKGQRCSNILEHSLFKLWTHSTYWFGWIYIYKSLNISQKVIRKQLCPGLFYKRICIFIKRETPAQMFSREYSEVFDKNFLVEQLRLTASRPGWLIMINVFFKHCSIALLAHFIHNLVTCVCNFHKNTKLKKCFRNAQKECNFNLLGTTIFKKTFEILTGFLVPFF